ncbi:MAG: hypothetical protein KTQ13_00495 [Ferruginibacter sp.]|nr:hypothetical protein [Chitinophagaceae bacterium]MBP6286022.1 hypothetical protein [Ferruginibacter sp.]MBU9935099.1 hypothetical protein [Ferruginibacter sp.]
MKRFRSTPLLLLVVLSLSGFQKPGMPVYQTGTLKIRFINTVKGKPVQLDSTVYTNPFSETYTITKFKYYISNMAVAFPDGIFKETDSYHLVDEGNPVSLSFVFLTTVNTYHSLLFTLGVDSLKNVSGAQTGALDPLNDMFWTWNSGYVMAKMEGRSPQSKVVNNKVEYHIGGFSGEHNVVKKLKLGFPAGMVLDIREGKTSEIIIEADLDTWWQHPNDLKISETPVCTTPGEPAKKIADNYSKMFIIKNIINH